MAFLVTQDGAVAELNAIPPRVRGHYLKMLLDWTVSTLLKSAFLLTSRTQGAIAGLSVKNSPELARLPSLNQYDRMPASCTDMSTLERRCI